MNRRGFIKSAARGGLFVPAAYAAAQEVFIDWVQAPMSGTEWITSVTGGTTRNNFDGDVGAEIIVGGSNVTVTHLGRWVVSGNSGSHVVSIWGSPYDATPTVVASATINTSGQPAGQFAYVSLGTHATLTASTVYVISSVEVNGGDSWYDNDTTITNTSVITLSTNAYRTGSTGRFFNWSGGKMYVPVSLKYS